MWFDVNKDGLANLLGRKGKEYIINELIQNAWDENVTKVEIDLTKEPGSRYANIRVGDDAPEGFANLSHAWTLFAESDKKGDAEKRGRFNLGEKLVLAVSEDAEIITTTGGVRFDAKGRHRLRQSRDCGSVFTARVKMTNLEFAACCAAVERLIPPGGDIVTTFNGQQLRPRVPVATFEASLKTEIADAEGNLRPTSRKTTVRVYKPGPGEVGTLYELGIPVVETGDPYHFDVGQKVPLNFDRDNVPPAYLATLRTLVLNAVHGQMPKTAATSIWARVGLRHKDVSPEAVRTVIDQTFGKAVIFDPSNLEANKLAAAEGYTVVTGRQLAAEEWANVKAAGALLPAGQVTPSDTRGKGGLDYLPRDQWTPAEAWLLDRYRLIAKVLLDVDIAVDLVDSTRWTSCGRLIRATYGDCHLTVNRAAHKPSFFDGIREDNLDLLIHELGHHYEGDHLSRGYYLALSMLGAKLALAAATQPRLFT